MALYHFTAAHLLKGILETGLTRGCTPVFDPQKKQLMLIAGTQWLTINRDFNQPWCDQLYSNLPYDRNAFRLRIELPESKRGFLRTWPEFYEGELRPRNVQKLQGFDDPKQCDPQNWRLFLGNIHPLWIKDFDENKNGYRSVPYAPIAV